MLLSPWHYALCPLDRALSFIYLSLSVVAISSLVVPFLRDLASHGKLRSSITVPNTSILQSEAVLVPKKLFIHFYITGIIATVVFYTFAVLSTGREDQNWPAILLLVAHLLRRTWECLYVHSWIPSSKMHLAGYALGLVHYVLLPLVFVDLQCSHDPVDSFDRTYFDWHVALAGTVTCVWGQYQQYRHHLLLASLRETSGSDSNKSRRAYKIPSTGWFRLVSCPHYLAEIIIYISVVTVLYSQQRAYHKQHQELALVIWVTINLSVSAISSHAWYLRRFPEYASLQRKAIIPYAL